MTTLVRLTIKQRRAEYATMLALLIGGTVAFAVLAAMVAALDLPHCLSVESATTARCQAASAQWAGLRGVGIMIAYGTAALSAIAGALVGVTLVAVEIEQRTAFLPWTIGTSRRRWLLERALVLVACCGIPCLALAVASDVAQQVMFPSVPVGASLNDYEFRGWLLPARMILGICAGILAGAMTGRSLPALILAIGLTAAIATSVGAATQLLTLSSVEEIDAAGGIVTQARYQDASGRLLTPEEASAVIPFDDPRFLETFRLVDFGVPGTRSPVAVASEIGLLAAASLTLVAMSLRVVDVRRPY